MLHGARNPAAAFENLQRNKQLLNADVCKCSALSRAPSYLNVSRTVLEFSLQQSRGTGGNSYCCTGSVQLIYTRKQQPAIGNLSNRSLHCASRILHGCRNLMCRRMARMHGEGSAGDEFYGKHVHSIKQPTLCLNLFSIVQPLVPFCVFFLMRCMHAGCSCGEPSALF